MEETTIFKNGDKQFEDDIYHTLAMIFEPTIRELFIGSKNRTEARVDPYSDFIPIRKNGVSIHAGLIDHGK